ncbi:MAG: hypothetical protein ACLUEK_00960 [Oscillospiraceae bacterium]
MHYRKNHLAAMQRALKVIDEVDAKFAESFGRYGGVLSEYRMEDAEDRRSHRRRHDRRRYGRGGRGAERGIRAGLVKLRAIRPFPAARLAKALSGVRAFCCVDLQRSSGWNCGPMYVETRAALAGAADRASFSAIGGLGGGTSPSRTSQAPSTGSRASRTRRACMTRSGS